MRHYNYSHLYYFWTVAHQGSIARAADVLNLTPQTISAQLKLLQEAVGQPLFVRSGRGLALTDRGATVKQYADEIFALGAELAHHLRLGEPRKPGVLNVGIVDSIPKAIAYRILEPAVTSADPLRIVCREAGFDELLSDLAVHRIDIVIADHAIPDGLNVKAWNQKLGDSTIGFFASEHSAESYATDFPQSLREAPVLLPMRKIGIRRDLDEWFERLGIEPRLVGEFENSALMTTFAEAGFGVFPAPTVIAEHIAQTCGARLIGCAEGIRQAYFALSPDNHLKHPAVRCITDAARSRLYQRARVRSSRQ